MLREYVVSEAMHALGVPTTRSLAVVATGGGCSARPSCPARCSRGSRQPPARRHASSTPAPPATSTCCAGWPTTRSTATTPRLPRRASATSPCSAPSSTAQAVAGRAVDARRVRPRRDEHRQRDDLRRDHRLRPLRLHGGLRPGRGLQLHRPRRALRLRQPAGGGGVEPRALRRGAAAAPRPRPGPGGRAGRRGAGRFRPAYSGGLARRERDKLGLPAAWPTTPSQPLAEDLLGADAAGRSTTRRFYRALAAAARGDGTPARDLFVDLAGYDAWRSGGGRRSRPRGHGPGQPCLRAAQPPRGGGPRRRDVRRSGPAVRLARGGDAPLRRTARAGAVRRARAGTSAPTAPSAAPDPPGRSGPPDRTGPPQARHPLLRVRHHHARPGERVRVRPGARRRRERRAGHLPRVLHRAPQRPVTVGDQRPAGLRAHRHREELADLASLRPGHRHAEDPVVRAEGVAVGADPEVAVGCRTRRCRDS